MRFSTFAIVFGAILFALPGVNAFADAAPPATAPAALNPARHAARQAERKAIRADIQAIRAAHKSHDKAAVQSDLAKLKTEWQALPPKAQKRIRQKHSALFKRLSDHSNRQTKKAKRTET